MGQVKDGNLFVVFPVSAICKCPSGLIRGPGKEDEDSLCWHNLLFSTWNKNVGWWVKQDPAKSWNGLSGSSQSPVWQTAATFCIMALHTWYCGSKLLILRITASSMALQPAAQGWWASLQTASQRNGWVVFLILTRAVIKSYWSLTFPRSLSAPLSLGCRSHVLWSHLSSFCCFLVHNDARHVCCWGGPARPNEAWLVERTILK